MSVLAALSVKVSRAGMTAGTLAGMIIPDQILGRQNPFTDVRLSLLQSPTFICGDTILEVTYLHRTRSLCSCLLYLPRALFMCASLGVMV